QVHGRGLRQGKKHAQPVGTVVGREQGQVSQGRRRTPRGVQEEPEEVARLIHESDTISVSVYGEQEFPTTKSQTPTAFLSLSRAKSRGPLPPGERQGELLWDLGVWILLGFGYWDFGFPAFTSRR